MEKIATDISSFENMRKGGYVYVDKTDLLWSLASDKVGRQFFISRPRRFGKSLMLSTLKCLFEGRRELFKGLKVEKKRWDWQKKRPVVMLNMADVTASSVVELKEGLIDTVDELVRTFDLKDVNRLSNPGKYLGNFFKALAAAKGEFVVLVDEYDVPLQGFLGDRAGIRAVRKLMHDFYIQLKNNSGDIRFMMMTGVTKLSVFSGLNNPEDLTMDHSECAGLLGYVPKEIEMSFPRRLDALAKKLKTDRKGALKRILDWYDSYRFCPDSRVSVCNPISIAKALRFSKIGSYWIKTAMSTLVMERIEAAHKSPDDFEGCLATEDELDVCDALELPAKALMYQSGYLTIKGLSRAEMDSNGNPKLILGAPNHEVRGALKAGWFDHFVKIPSTEFEALVEVAKRQLAEGSLDALVSETLFRVYAKIPPTWRIRCEADAKRHFLLFMEMLGARVFSEASSAHGYADAIVETPKFVWVFEFKFQKSVKAALAQIREKGYADAYKGDRRPVTLVGINFRLSKRNIDEPLFAAL